MVTTNKKTTEGADYTMKEKITALYELQKIDSKIDEINKVKGELPMEVSDLEDQVAGLQTRIDNIGAEIAELNMLTKQRKEEIEQNKLLIAKYEEQQRNVRNNREFDSISKEIEYQDLQNQLCEKHIKEYGVEIKAKKKVLEEAEEVMTERKADLEAKRSELDSIDSETAKEIAEYEAQAAVARERIDDRLLAAYTRIRSNVRNGLAVVTVKRDACGGCYNRIPPQRQCEIRQSRKVIVCEYCGRILVDDEEHSVE